MDTTLLVLPVAGAAYGSTQKAAYATHTHACEMTPDGDVARTLCRKVKPSSILLDLVMVTDEPSCPVCKARLAKRGK